jgi:hypothetical protein
MCVVGVVYWLELRCGTGGVVFGSVVYGGEYLHLRGGNMYLELVRIRDYFLAGFAFV